MAVFFLVCLVFGDCSVWWLTVPVRFVGLFFGLLLVGLALVLVFRCFGVSLLGFGFVGWPLGGCGCLVGCV